MKRISVSLGLLLWFLPALLFAQFKLENVVFPLPEETPHVLTPVAKITFQPILEGSAIVKSRTQKNVYWTLNDSGDKARIFAIDSLGRIIKPRWASRRYEGILIPDAVNVDWEDIAVDDAGLLYIADTGNNDNRRRDLTIYVIAEPDPTAVDRSSVLRKIFFRFPDQKQFPPEKKNFDCEALFWNAGKLYVLTKHRSDTHTKLYRLDATRPFVINTATFLGEYDVKGMVTAADASPDGTKLAVLTYTGVWLFHKPETSDNFLAGKAFVLPIIAKQCEGVCFDGDHLKITNEQREIFQVRVEELLPAKRE